LIVPCLQVCLNECQYNHMMKASLDTFTPITSFGFLNVFETHPDAFHYFSETRLPIQVC